MMVSQNMLLNNFLSKYQLILLTEMYAIINIILISLKDKRNCLESVKYDDSILSRYN